MLKLKGITKHYIVADTTIEALRGIDLCFRKNEFVSILGPSGCGKTTLLNIIGGLDKYTSGDLFINGRSTKEYKDRDWDVYRNHRIGFIFQSYNLIPHQTVLGNVELALTIAGLPKAERIERAKQALDRVGLSNQYYKKPNQLSGGQCQRVAIARALVNEPEILLADEPTGALDTVTSIQIMDLIQEIAKERLVIMVTHNPDLANQYSTRIVKLLDGSIVEDSNPYSEEEESKEAPVEEKTLEALSDSDIKVNEKVANKETREKAKMSFWTAFKLSARNLRSKLKRTIMVVVAGSIGIIGVTAVLSVSTGVHDYIDVMQDDMLSGNPITIGTMAIDMNSLMNGKTFTERKKALEKGDWVNSRSVIGYLIENEKALESLVSNNEISKDYIDYVLSMPKENYNAISLDYGVDFTASIYTDFAGLNNMNQKISLNAINQTYSAAISMLGTTDGVSDGEYGKYASAITALTTPVSQSVPNNEYILSQYDLVDGQLPKNENECIIVINKDHELTDLILAQLGYYSQREFYDMVYNKMDMGDQYTSKERFTYEEIRGKTFTWYKNDDIYTENTDIINGYRANILAAQTALMLATTDAEREAAMKDLTRAQQQFITATDLYTYNYKVDSSWKGKELKVCGIVKPKDNISYGCLPAGLLYTEEFARNAVKENVNSKIVNLVKTTRTLPLNGRQYNAGIQISYKLNYAWESKLNNTDYSNYNDERIVSVGKENALSSIAAAYGLSLSSSTGPAMTLASLGGFTNADGNIIPQNISIYPINFEQKDKVTKYLDEWNQIDEENTPIDVTFNVLDENLNPITENGVVKTKTLKAQDRLEIKYTDNVQLIISMINTMIDIVTYALVAFTALSLVVSCVMIAIITYVSVMERIKEIGVIRSLGGRKKDVSHLFNAENFMMGLASGIFGIVITGILSILINVIVNVASDGTVKSIAHLTVPTALIMVMVSILLTCISGFIPARSAAKKDPVVALRTE